MDGPGRGGDLRFRRAGVARASGPGRRQGLQPRSDHRRHSRRLRDRPYEIVNVAGMELSDQTGVRRGRPGGAWRAAKERIVEVKRAYPDGDRVFSADHRGELSQFLGREVSRDAIASLRGEGFIAAGPRSPTPGAPYAYVTTPGFLAQFGFESLRDLPDIEKLEDAGRSVGRARTRLMARRWIPSCGGARAEERRRSTRGGCSMMMSHARGRQ